MTCRPTSYSLGGNSFPSPLHRGGGDDKFRAFATESMPEVSIPSTSGAAVMTQCLRIWTVRVISFHPLYIGAAVMTVLFGVGVVALLLMSRSAIPPLPPLPPLGGAG